MLNIWKAGRGYKSSIKAGILGEDSDDESGSGSNDDDSEEEGKYQFLSLPLFRTGDSCFVDFQL